MRKTGRRADGKTGRLLVVAAAAVLAGCAHSLNYSDVGPRYVYAGPAADSARHASDTLRVVTFNVQFSNHPALARDLLMENDSLNHADVVLLQEMDEMAVKTIAAGLHMGYVYYPASQHWKTGRDFGNAILSRWPLVDDRKILLPHLSRFNAQQRIAVGATMMVGDRAVRVYSVHLATMVNNGPTARREQLAAVLADADSFPTVLIAGDMNSETVPEISLTHHYTWPSRGLPRTESFWTLDHVLLRGMSIAGDAGIGIVSGVGQASDHKPVWARAVLAPMRTPPTVVATQ